MYRRLRGTAARISTTSVRRKKTYWKLPAHKLHFEEKKLMDSHYLTPTDDSLYSEKIIERKYFWSVSVRNSSYSIRRPRGIYRFNDRVIHISFLNFIWNIFPVRNLSLHFDISSSNVTSVDPQGLYAINKYEARQSSTYNTEISYIKQDLKKKVKRNIYIRNKIAFNVITAVLLLAVLNKHQGK
jgi:hypothetical protein